MAVLTATFAWTACKKEWKPDRNIVRIQKDKPISQAIFFEKDASKEQKAELISELKSKVAEYNDSFGKDLIVITKPKDDKTKIEDLNYAVLDYPSMTDFGRFNQYSVYFGDPANAEQAGFSIHDTEFLTVEKNQADASKVVKAEEIAGETMRLLVLDPAIQPFAAEGQEQGELNYFEVEDAQVAYVSANILLTENEELTVAPDSQTPGYVIYR